MRPILRSCPRGSIRLLSAIGGGRQDDADWIQVPRRFRSFYDSGIGALVTVDLAEWGGRWYYYTSKYYDPVNQMLIGKILGPGDTYIDVGANLGIHTLLASKTVGPGGHVYSFEPNPETFDLLSAHLAINRISNVVAQRLALSDGCGTAPMRVDGRHSGCATLRSGDDTDTTVAVQISTGDTVLRSALRCGNMLLKIDVEGFELKVLVGMTRFLRESHPIISIEITPQWIEQTGGLASDLLELLGSIGYQGYKPVLSWKWGFLPTVSLLPLKMVVDQTDVLFIHNADKAILRRLQRS